MPEIEDGETAQVQGSAREPYILKNIGGVYSCTCPAWRNQSTAIEARTCKHLRNYLGEEFEKERLGGTTPSRAVSTRARQASSSPADENGSGEQAGKAEPGLLLAHSWDGQMDLSGWWMSEKLDGVRAYWDGKQFISRQGNVYLAPDWFVEDLPTDLHLDGELWLERKGFQRAVSIVRRQDRNNDWKQINFVVFDAPQIDDVFEARVAHIQQALDELRSRYTQAHLHVRCNSIEHLREELARVEALGGEGLMLRQPGSKYEVGRSFSLLKVKTFHDAEAKVLEHLPGTGRHKGRMGALSVEMSGGVRFSVGTGFSDAERESPPPVGSIITFRYQELSDRGVPRFPSFVRMRTDIDSISVSSSPQVTAPVHMSPAVSGAGSSQAIASAKTGAKTTAEKAPTITAEKMPSAYTNSAAWRQFEFVEGSSSKFWHVCVNGNDVIVKFGRIGTAGQEKTKSFSDAASASNYAADITKEKIGKGYAEKNP